MKRFIGWFSGAKVGFITGSFVGLIVLGQMVDMFLFDGEARFVLWGLFGLLAWGIVLLLGISLRRWKSQT